MESGVRAVPGADTDAELDIRCTSSLHVIGVIADDCRSVRGASQGSQAPQYMVGMRLRMGDVISGEQEIVFAEALEHNVCGGAAVPGDEGNSRSLVTKLG